MRSFRYWRLIKLTRRVIWRSIRVIRMTVVMMVAGVIGRLRKPHQVLVQKSKDGFELGSNVVLFLHWDRAGRVREELFAYIAQFRDAGRSVVFVTNAGKLDPTAERRLMALCAGVIIRRNVGYDFGGWRDAIETLDLPRPGTKEIIIANDSVFGPVRPLEATLSRLDYAEADVWGLTDSWQRRYHLQSYFVAFGSRAIHSPVFREFWAKVLPAPSKEFIIRKYEIGMTQAILQSGLRVSAVWPYDQLIRQVERDLRGEYLVPEKTNQMATMLDIDHDPHYQSTRSTPLEANTDEVGDHQKLLRRRQLLRLRHAIVRRKALNPTADLWRQLLLAGFPLIKRELLFDNPTRVEDVAEWANVLHNECGVDPEILSVIEHSVKQRLKGERCSMVD